MEVMAEKAMEGGRGWEWKCKRGTVRTAEPAPKPLLVECSETVIGGVRLGGEEKFGENNNRGTGAARRMSRGATSFLRRVGLRIVFSFSCPFAVGRGVRRARMITSPAFPVYPRQ